MNKNRLEALSDGIFAVIMTIVVLEFKVPADGNLASPALLFALTIYVTTFVTLAAIWNVHHHVLAMLSDSQLTEGILWLNHVQMLLMSLFPFVTIVHATYPHSLSGSIGYAADYLVVWLGMMIYGHVVNRKLALDARLREHNRRHWFVYSLVFIPSAIISIFWFYILPIATVLMAVAWGLHERSDK